MISRLLGGEATGDEDTKKWICSICGHDHRGDEPPDECPVYNCFARPDEFERVDVDE